MPGQLRNWLIALGAVGLPLLAQLAADAAGLDAYDQGILFKIGLNVTLAVGLSLIIGFAGQFSIGHAGFMSIGAFASGLFTSRFFVEWTAGFSPEFLDSGAAGAILLRAGLLLLTTLVGMIAALLAAVLVGLPSLRLRGDYLAIATLGFGEITYNLLLIYLQKTQFDTAYYMPFNLNFMTRPVNIASSWILAILSILIVRNLVNSTSGRAFPAIREDEIAAGAVGIRTTRYKMLAFVIGSALAGAAGVLEAHQTQTVNPASYRFDRSIEMIVPVVLGGSGSLTGCVVAAAGFTYLLELLRDLPAGAQQYRTIVYAGVLVLFMIVRPQGLMGRWELRDLVARLRRRKPGHCATCGSDLRGSTERCPECGTATDRYPTAPSPGLITTAPAGVNHGASLECRDLTIRFGGLTAVSRFQLDMQPGEIVGLIGPNGAGKTTCFNMITGVYRPTAGDIRLGGSSLVGLGPAAINNRGIARTFQNIRLFGDLTVLDNVRTALHAHLRTGAVAAILRSSAFYREEQDTRRRALQLLELFGLGRWAQEVAHNLPYGDQRRLEIARDPATRPRVLCLDEPAAGMNPAEKQDLMNLIRRVRDQFSLTILLIEHDMKVVMGVCERILVLDHGETIAQGRPEDIRDNPKVIEAYLGEPKKCPPAP